MIVSGGGVKCWGSNQRGQLGVGSRTDATSPADVAGDDGPSLLAKTILHPLIQTLAFYANLLFAFLS